MTHVSVTGTEIEPTRIVATLPVALADLLLDLVRTGDRVGASLTPETRVQAAAMIRILDAHYSNRIEGNFTSMDWAAFLRAHNLEHSMSRRGNCHDNAVAESF